MNTIIRYSTILAVSILMMVACRDEDKVRFPDMKTGVNARVSLYADRSYVNLDNLSNASIAFDIYSINTDLEEIVYTATFTDADSATAIFPQITAFTVPASQFVSGKVTELNISATELADKFGLPGGVAYLEGGDNVTFNASVKLKDGRVFDASNSAPSITGGTNSSFTTQFTVFVGCPSPQDKIVGEYYSVMVYNNFGIPVGDTVEVEVTFKGPEPFRYEVTDFTGELYLIDPAGKQFPGSFYDLCGTAILQPTSTNYGDAINFVSDEPDFLSPSIVINGDDVEFALNWFETNNEILASVKFVKRTN